MNSPADHSAISAAPSKSISNGQPSQPTSAPQAEAEMGLFDHLAELRVRLLYSFLSTIVGAVLCYSYSRELFELLNQPYYDAFGRETLIGTGPAEAFILKLKVSLCAGVIVASPLIFYQIWRFVEPGLYDHEKKLVIPFLLATTGFFAAGIAFSYFALFPFAFYFFKEQYTSIDLTPTIRLSEHLSMMVTGLLGLGIVFQMPVLAFFLGRMGLITHHTLVAGMRYAVVAIFVVAAIITPPDVLTQFLIAGPLFILYLLSIAVVKYSSAKKETTVG